ncbi:site-2 protease family protein [Candidatus Uabimicrobium sp. HlEnr_7]|uniref:site-2 protease family protein n=1 Tax=Candidatus Uabimicrobium helgolandensis TaxID=3095367 RepID=UPI003558DAD9
MNSLTKSFYLGRIWGIDVFIHSLFFVFFGLLGLMHILSSGILSAVVFLFFLTLVFGCVLLHEYGHCLVAKHYKIPVQNITLTPIGGVASIGAITNPDIELKVTIAGPLVNFVIALILLPLAVVSSYVWNNDFCMYLVTVNVILMVFNLIPAFPMDGGRILRALLSKKMSLVRATEKAVEVGTWAAIIMAITGVFVNPMLIFIAAFVYLAGRAELKMISSQAYVHFPHDNTRTQHFYAQDQQELINNLRKIFYRR